MNEKRRNIAVGLTVLVGLGLLCTLIVIFTGMPGMLQRGYVIKMNFPETYEAISGDPVYYAGIKIGSVVDVAFADEQDPRKGVVITARIDTKNRLPGNTKAFIVAKGFMGKGALTFVAEGQAMKNPVTGREYEFLPTDNGDVTLTGEYRSSSIVPDEVTDAFKGISKISDSLAMVISPEDSSTTKQAATSCPTGGGLAGTVGRINVLTDRLIETSERAGRLVDTMNQMASRISEGQGTAGKILTDPKLYNALVDSSVQLGELIKDLRALAETWKKEGMGVKMK